MQTRRSFLRTSLAATTAVLADVSSIVAKERPVRLGTNPSGVRTVSKSPSEAYVGGVKFLTPDAPDYAAAREVYNAGILTQPKIIAFCVSETGVQHAEPPDKVIADVQALLQQMGYYTGEVDGLLGPLTREAVSAYQADQGLTATAVIDQPTLDSLGLA